jgi:hypothetical protein
LTKSAQSRGSSAFPAAGSRALSIENAMAGAQRGTEFALCLNSVNRDVASYPEPNDFTLDLRDRYDLQMMVLGSLELPYTQLLIEDAWSTFSFDVGLALSSSLSRSLNFKEPPVGDVVFLPAPFLQVRRTSISSATYEGQDGAGAPVAHGLGFGSLACFPSDAVRIVLVPARPPPEGAPFQVLQVSRVVSQTQLQVEKAPAVGTGMDGLLIVAAANTRTFFGPMHLAECLQAYCSQPFAGFEFLKALRFSYSAESMDLTLRTNVSGLAVSLEADTSLLFALSFNLPQVAVFALPDALVSGNFPRQSSCRAPARIGALGLPSRPVAVKYNATRLPAVCIEATGPACGELGMSARDVQIPPANYEPAPLQRISEYRINNRSFLEIPPPPGGPGSNVVLIHVWGAAPSAPDAVEIAPTAPIASFHPAGIAAELSSAFDAAATKLRWTYENDRFCVRPVVPGTVFRIVWPSEDPQMLAFRLRINDSIAFATEIAGEQLHYAPSPTQVIVPAAERLQPGLAKHFMFTARPKLVPGCPFRVRGLPVIQAIVPGESVVKIKLGALPLETPVLVRAPDADYSAATSRFGVVACDSSADGCTYIALFGARAPDISSSWRVDAIPLHGGAFNIYFPRAQVQCWSRLAEIYGFRSGANLCSSASLVAPWQWNFDQPSYVLLDLGLQHMSATITHRCGNSVLTQFFGKIVLYPPFKEMRMTPIQAVGTGVSVVSSLHLRLLNPWHQLYELHGRNWSLTVILASNTKAARTDCL